jgi:hypothetical protein
MTTLGTFRDDYYNSMAALGQNQFTSFATAGSLVLSATVMAGAQEVYVQPTAAGTATYTTDTAANIIARLQNAVQAQLNALGQAGISSVGSPPPGVPNLFNASYYLDIMNPGAGTITLAAGTGVTFGTGTYSVLTATSTGFLVTVTGPASVTIQRISSGTL